MKQSAPAADNTAQDDPATYWGTLSPGASLSGTYLWRDVSPCSRQDGTVTSLASGTYTLLVMQSVSLQQYSDGTGIATSGIANTGIVPPSRLGGGTSSGVSGAANGSSGDGTSTAQVAPAPTNPIATDPIAVDPMPPTVGPVQQDWLDLQVWSSLGTVTITTH